MLHVRVLVDLAHRQYIAELPTRTHLPDENVVGFMIETTDISHETCGTWQHAEHVATPILQTAAWQPSRWRLGGTLALRDYCEPEPSFGLDLRHV